ncbi:glycosyltransferase [Roseibium aggregatum]|uniref:glycosyltransferase n=1 Tax=Roseibium aggregatum TaxID=187304 RepID=UPI0025ACAC1F|nr:glycosyltransferase [Roseibium aggregatum]WJS05532.1 glycosyltransferase [Roseibium aggregatum]
MSFDSRLGRPWTHFDLQKDEWPHASSLVPTNAGPFLFDSDHLVYCLQQSGYPLEGEEERSQKMALAKALASPDCLGVVAHGGFGKASFDNLFETFDLTPPSVIAVHPSAAPPLGPVTAEEEAMLKRLQGRLEPGKLRMLSIDCQPGICEIGDRKNKAGAATVLQRARDLGLPYELVMIDRMATRDRSEECFHVLPRLTRAALWRVYGLCDVLLFLTRSEALGVSLGEGMSHGLVVLASDAPSSPASAEFVRDGETGFLINFRRPAVFPEMSDDIDIDQILNRLSFIATRPEERQAISIRAANLFTPFGLHGFRTRNSRIRHLVENGVETAAKAGREWALKALDASSNVKN